MNNDFPALVYKDKGPHQRAGGSYDYQVVQDLTSFEAALADGWFATLPEAISGLQEGTQKLVSGQTSSSDQVQDENAPVTREELEAKATELGLKFDGRTSDKKLGDLIKATLED